jgi:hypothetical protein
VLAYRRDCFSQSTEAAAVMDPYMSIVPTILSSPEYYAHSRYFNRQKGSTNIEFRSYGYKVHEFMDT